MQKQCFPQQTIYCLLPCWFCPAKSCGPHHFHVPTLVCMLSTNLRHWGFFSFLFSFWPFSQSQCIMSRMKKANKHFDNISSSATIKLSCGFAEEFGVLIFRTCPVLGTVHQSSSSATDSTKVGCCAQI